VVALREKLQLRIEDDPYGDCPAPIQSFDQLAALPKDLLGSLLKNGITAPMPIQAQALPLVLQGRDVIGLAQTGSGKTLAFLLPAAVHLEKQASKRVWQKTPAPFVLVLAPTRELAVQIADEANKVFDVSAADAKKDWVSTVAVYGGGDKQTQQKKLRYGYGADIVAATPGRLTDFMNTGVVSLHRVSYFVLDEADRMLDMGFNDDVTSIAKELQPQKQMLFFSATWGKEVQELAQGLCRSGSKPVRISYGQESNAMKDGSDKKHIARESIVQEVVVVDHKGDKHWEKQEAEKEGIMDKHLQRVLTESDDNKVLVFVSQKNLADKLSSKLQARGFKADAMHGGKSQEYRLWVLDQFRKGELRLLVCTDVLGRGIDIPSVSHVVIHEMGEIEDYIHRIGRTARGKHGKGHALVFFEYWDGDPKLAADLIEVLTASKQTVPPGLQKIADEVATGKRESRAAGWNTSNGWKDSSFAKQSNKWNAWGK
jgi:ATP-dependent RNA helicase DDX5/DBP2